MDGMKRTMLSQEAKSAGETSFDRMFLREIVYPSLICAADGVLTIDGKKVEWPPDFETFTALPEYLGLKWEEEVFEKNPHWKPKYQENQEKKVPSTSGE